jgi:hypothetical protein
MTAYGTMTDTYPYMQVLPSITHNLKNLSLQSANLLQCFDDRVSVLKCLGLAAKIASDGL